MIWVCGLTDVVQLFTSGTRMVPCDFLIPAQSHHPIRDNLHHKVLAEHYGMVTSMYVRVMSDIYT